MFEGKGKGDIRKHVLGASIGWMLILGMAVPMAAAQSTSPESPPAKGLLKPQASSLTAPQATSSTSPAVNDPAALVRKANEKLQQGDPEAALKLYEKAETLAPDAREIAFGEGLAAFDLGRYDEARERFRKAMGDRSDDLSANALYGLGACDHAEALGKMQTDPQTALGLLESAMSRYQDVLAQKRDHPYAKNAHLKAGLLWKQIKQQLQQRPQPSPSQDSDKQKEEGDRRQQQNRSPQDKKQDQKQDQQQASRNEQQETQKPEASDQQQQSNEAKNKQQKQQPQQARPEEKRISREQTERRLRELMQMLRQREKHRRPQREPIRVAPADKDW